MKEFWQVLTAPETWNPISVAVVGLAALWALGILAGAAFDAQFPG